MKRLALVLLLALSAVPAHAKTMIVVDRTNWGAMTTPPPADLQAVDNERRQLEDLKSVLDRLGATYRIVPSSLMKTEFLRTGVMVWNYGTAGARADTFDASIVVAFNGRASSATGISFRADSLTLSNPSSASGGLPTKPVLFLLNPDVVDINSAFHIDGTAGQRCSTGVSEQCNSGDCTGSHENERCLYVPGFPEAFSQFSFSASMVRNSTPPAGGIRTLLAARSNPQFLRYYWSGTFAADQDSIGRDTNQSNADSIVVWERPMAHVSGAATQVYAIAASASVNTTDTTGAFDRYSGVASDLSVLAFAVQRLDSLAGGRVLGGDYKKIRMAAVIRGVGNKAGDGHYQGYQVADSVTIKAACDSVAQLRIPITLAADPDSMGADEAAWWKRMGRVKFTPSPRIGHETAVGNVAATATSPKDIFGRFRVRNVYGPLTGDSANVYSGLVFERNKLQDIVGKDYMSKTVVPPHEDWTPRPISKSVGFDKIDSLLWVFNKAGYRALIHNVQDPVQTQPTFTTGWAVVQGKRRIRFGDEAGSQFTIAGYNGYRLGGSYFSLYGANDTTFVGDPYTNNVGTIAATILDGVFFHGARNEAMTGPGTAGQDFAGVFLNQNISIYSPQYGTVMLLGSSEFTSNHGSTKSPDFPGYWQLKHFVHWSRCVNRMGYNGRSIIEWVFPEDI